MIVTPIIPERRRSVAPVACLTCGAMFLPKRTQKYCSHRCQKRAELDRGKVERAAAPPKPAPKPRKPAPKPRKDRTGKARYRCGGKPWGSLGVSHPQWPEWCEKARPLLTDGMDVDAAITAIHRGLEVAGPCALNVLVYGDGTHWQCEDGRVIL